MQGRTTLSTKNSDCREEHTESKDILSILELHREDKGGLISILEAIQSKYGYLPENALRIISRQTGRSLVDVYGVATFYKFFSLKPKGKHLICACLGTACHVRGAPRIVAEIEHQLGIKADETTLDKEFSLETVNCLGACALGPVVVGDGNYFSKVRKSGVKQILDHSRYGLDTMAIEKDERIFPINAVCPHCHQSFKDYTFIIDGHPCLKMKAANGHSRGWIRLSCLYGSYSVSTELEIPEGATANFICPHCDSELSGKSDCSQCGAPMTELSVDGGGIVQICSRRGCKNHSLDLD